MATNSTRMSDYSVRFPPGAKIRLTKLQWIVSGALFLAPPAIALASQVSLLQCLQAFVAGCTLFFTAMLGFALTVVVQSLRPQSLMKISMEDTLEFAAHNMYPFVTVMVAMYHEVAVVSQILEQVQKLRYPLYKLEILFVLEADDHETLAELRKHKLPFRIKIIVRPRGVGAPTKPGALQYAVQNKLIDPKSEVTVVFDAEDMPDENQILKAVTAMHLARQENPSVVCIQARLAFSQNANKNWLTRMINLDYLNHFGLMLPGLARLRFVAPLGGTSNYLQTWVLQEIGWDEFNVTEDLDLAVWLARKHLGTQVLDSVTSEEAVTTVKAFYKQKSRWNKGGIQTYFVHMRNPIQLWRDLGGVGFMAFQAVVAAPLLLYLINPMFWLLTALYALTKSPLIESLYPPLVFYLASMCFVVGNFLFIYFIMSAAFRTKQYGMVFFALCAPIYWMLLSLAAFKAFVEFFGSTKSAQKWEKTTHHGAS